MAEYLSPGVYVEEHDASPRSIEGVGTSTAGFIGMTVKGPSYGAPTLCTSFADFQRQFGGYLSEFSHGLYRYLPISVEQFFANGGTRCFISRVIPENATVAEGETQSISIRAANEGKWGNRIVMSFATVNERKMQLMEKLSDLTYRAKHVAGFTEGDLVVFEDQYNRILSIINNQVTFEEIFDKDPVDAALVPQNLIHSVEIDIVIRHEGEMESFLGLNLEPSSRNYVGTRLQSSKLVAMELTGILDAIKNPVVQILGNEKTSGVLTLSGGSDGTMDAVNAGVYIGQDNGPGKRTGIQSFKENSIASIIAVPGITIPEVVVSLVAHCELEQSRFAVLDVPIELVKTGDIIEYRSMIDSTYAAMYHPWIQVFDPITKKSGYVPPSGAVAGVYSRTDVTRGVHKAPANESIACTGLSTNYNIGEQDILNPAGVNLIRALPGHGIRVWGARTASSNSSFKYVNVRRLFIYVEQSIKNSTNWVVFEPNNASLWSRVGITVSNFLETMFRGGMLSGESSGQAYFVEIGQNTMSQDDILNGRLICEIGIAPSRPAEFVIFKVSQITADASGGGA